MAFRDKIFNIFKYKKVFYKVVLTWVILILLLLLGLRLDLDTKILSMILILIAFLTKAFSGLLLLVGLVPVIGPIIVQVLTLPIFWLLNGIGYFASIIAIKKGHGKEVITYRILTAVFLVGVAVGYIISRVLG